MEFHGPATECTPGQQAEIASRFVRAIPKAVLRSGLTPTEVIRCTNSGELLERAFGIALRTLYKDVVGVPATDWNRPPFNPHGWQVISHADNGSWWWDCDKVELWPGVMPQEATVGMLIDAVAEVPVLNAKVAELLALHGSEVPSEWQDKHVVFPGTVFKDGTGERRIIGIYYHAGKPRSTFALKSSEKWHPSWVVATLKREEE